MLTDDDLVTRLHGSFEASVADLVPDPALLTRVRHAHHKSVRRQRLLAPAGIAVLGLAAAGTYAVWPSGGAQLPDRLAASPAASPDVSPTAEAPGPTVKLFGYTFTLPSGFVVNSVKDGDASKQELSANNGERTIHLTVYRGAIADAIAAAQPSEPSAYTWAPVAGFPSRTYVYAAGGPECVTKGSDRSIASDHAVGPCGQERGETRVTTGLHELVVVMTEDVSLTFVTEILESGL